MGLYLAVFDGDEEVDGVEIGPYEAFGQFRDYVVQRLQRGSAGDRFPVLIHHSDCDGEWSVEECERLRLELKTIAEELRRLPAEPFGADWQRQVAKSIGLIPVSAFETFIDVDGEFLVDRLLSLVETAVQRDLPIVFQ